MARGKFARITYRTGVGTDSVEIEATRAGGDVIVTQPDARTPFITVTEYASNNDVIRQARFATAEVVAIVEGQKPAKKLGGGKK